MQQLFIYSGQHGAYQRQHAYAAYGNTNYAMGVKKYEDNDTDDKVTKGIMLADGKVVDKNSLVTICMGRSA